jgi:hypothetical protein
MKKRSCSHDGAAKNSLQQLPVLISPSVEAVGSRVQFAIRDQRAEPVGTGLYKKKQFSQAKEDH